MRGWHFRVCQYPQASQVGQLLIPELIVAHHNRKYRPRRRLSQNSDFGSEKQRFCLSQKWSNKRDRTPSRRLQKSLRRLKSFSTNFAQLLLQRTALSRPTLDFWLLRYGLFCHANFAILEVFVQCSKQNLILTNRIQSTFLSQFPLTQPYIRLSGENRNRFDPLSTEI